MNQDEHHLQQLKDGDPSAYESLVDEFQGRLFRFFFCHHRDHHLAEEQLSETFVQLVRSLPKMKSGASSLPVFVFAVARHVRAQAWKKKHRSHSSLEAEEEMIDSSAIAETVVENREQLQVVLDAVSAMAPSRRDVFLLRFVEGYSNGEIAEALNMPVGSVKSHIHRGRVELKEFVAKLGFEL